MDWHRLNSRLVALGLALTIALGAFVAQSASDQQIVDKPRGASPKVPTTITPGSVPLTGEFWLLIIGIDKYQYAPKLATAVRDAESMRDVLIERYGFKRDRILQLFNEEATGGAILNELDRLGRTAGKEDSVLIYYAGHGEYDEDRELGWWVPVDGDPSHRGATFITNASIREYINGMKAKHVLLVADSCFSGALLGTRALLPKGVKNTEWVARLAAKPSRYAITSGNNEPVTDRGKDGHSVFAYHLLRLLKENVEPYVVPEELFPELASLVTINAAQTPQWGPIRMAGHGNGQFVFRLLSAGGGSVAGGAMSATGTVSPSPGPSATASNEELERMKAQITALEKQRQEEAQRLAEQMSELKAIKEQMKQAGSAERANLDVERKKVEAERKESEQQRRQREQELAEKQAALDAKQREDEVKRQGQELEKQLGHELEAGQLRRNQDQKAAEMRPRKEAERPTRDMQVAKAPAYDNVLADIQVQAKDTSTPIQLDWPNARFCVVVSYVAARSSAEKTGLQQGDLICEVNHEVIKNPGDYYAASSKVKKNESVVLLVNRQGNTVSFLIQP